MRILVPRIWVQRSDLARAHAIEIAATAPELADLLGEPRRDFASALAGSARIRDRRATRRFAHGAISLLQAWSEEEPEPLRLSFSRVDEADCTDQEFLAILLRRANPERLQVTVATRSEDVSEELGLALHLHAQRTEEIAEDSPGASRTAADLLSAYIAADGTATDPAEVAAYQNADPALRAALHDERATELDRLGELTWHLGAIPYHRERGTDPREAGSKALLEAASYCLIMGFFDALLDLSQRGLALVDPATQTERYWLLSGKAATALATFGRLDDAEAVYLKVRSLSALPRPHMNNSHALGMLGMRQGHPYTITRGHLSNALAIASLLPDQEERTVNSMVITANLAMQDFEAGHLDEALTALTSDLDRFAADLPSGAHLDHLSVFAHQRATTLVRLDRIEDAISDFSAAIRMDAKNPVYYADRAAALLRLGRLTEALRDYDAAVSRTPPFWELHHDRAAARTLAGDPAGAIEDLTTAIDLEPGELDPWVSMAGLLLELDDPATARARIDQGLAFHPDDPLLICLRAQAHAAQGRTDLAWQDYDLALAGDATLTAALAGRADLAYTAGDHRSAIADLTRAIDTTPDDPDLRYNRALLYQATSDWHAAISDYTHALTLPGTDQDDIHAGLHHCHSQLRQPHPAEAS